MEEHKAESRKSHEVGDQATSVIPSEASDNLVLRKLIRGRRYFDPPNSFWRTCYKCGDEGHTAGNCSAVRLRKPCYKCGRRNHNVKRCTKRKDCLICKKGGHRAKDCPEKYPGPQDAQTCLKCGDSGHTMFSCRNSYSEDDLKHIQCYICGNLGHLCCVEYTDSGPAEVSCYRCGQPGHTGLACFDFKAKSLTSCYKCGEEGHFAQKCPSSPEVGDRNSELVTPKERCLKENNPEVTLLPNDCNGYHPIIDFDDEGSLSVSDHTGWHATDSNSNHKGAWTTNDHPTSNGDEYKVIGWPSPETVGNISHSFSASQFESTSSDVIHRE
ncbi:hypothetical protein LIER_35906 [Lithospermum erythrorhizon]|uniref:CCHC-type domain-containing protein n=1 Tax=Lithospermum erythrorhizon TaxID=34254 RepID=A0AAV3NYC2_LITER